MEENGNNDPENLMRIASQAVRNRHPVFSSPLTETAPSSSYSMGNVGTLFDDTIFQPNPLATPLRRISRQGPSQNVARNPQPYNHDVIGDGENVIGNLSVNYGGSTFGSDISKEPDPRCTLNAASTFLVGNITRNLQSRNLQKTSSNSVTSNPVQASRKQSPLVSSSLVSTQGNKITKFRSHDHERMMSSADPTPDTLQHGAFQGPQIDGRFLSLGVQTTDGYTSDDHVGTIASDNTAMANAIRSSRLSRQLIDGSSLSAGHGCDTHVGFQTNDHNRSGQCLNMCSNTGSGNLPSNHNSMMGVTSVGGGPNPFSFVQTPQVHGHYQVPIPSSQFIGFGGIGDVRNTVIDPYRRFYYYPASTSSQSMGVQSAIINNEQASSAAQCSVARQPTLSFDLNRSPLQQQLQSQAEQQQQQQCYQNNISGANANILAHQIYNPCNTFDPLSVFAASAQGGAARFGYMDNCYGASVQSAWETNTLKNHMASPIVGTSMGISSQNHSGRRRPADDDSAKLNLTNPSTPYSHQAHNSFNPDSIANANQQDKLSAMDKGSLVRSAKGSRSKPLKGKSMQAAAEGNLTAQNSMIAEPNNRRLNQVNKKKTIQTPPQGSSSALIQLAPTQHGHGKPRPSSEPTGGKDHVIWSGTNNDPPSTFLSGHKCYICKRDLRLNPIGPISRPGETIPSAILGCGHTFHEECLSKITPKEQASDPLCIPCAMDEQ